MQLQLHSLLHPGSGMAVSPENGFDTDVTLYIEACSCNHIHCCIPALEWLYHRKNSDLYAQCLLQHHKVSEHHASTFKANAKVLQEFACVQVMATCGALAWAYIIMPAEPRKKTPVLQVLTQDSQKILHETPWKDMLGTSIT